MISYKSSPTPSPWRAWTFVGLVGALALVAGPYFLEADAGADKPAALVASDTPAQAAPAGPMGDVEQRLRKLEDQIDRVLQGLKSRRDGTRAQEQIVASGNVVTKEVEVADFTSVRVGSAITVEIARADAFKVTVSASDNLQPYIQTVKEGKTLRIDMERGKNYQSRGEQIRVAIAMPALEVVDLSGASRMTVNGFKPKEFKAKMAGASTLKGAIEADKVAFDANGASTLTLTGSAKEALLTAAGASTLRLADFPLGSAVVNLTGASTATVQTKASLLYDVSGASSLKYLDSPKVVGKKSGASSVSRK